MLKIVNPYPGFESGFYRPYSENEHDLFFGREKDIAAIKLKIRQRKLVSLVSDEKMGRTSLLRGGLIPNLRNKPFDGYRGNVWKCLYMMPDKNPVYALAKALVNPSNKLSDKIKPSMEEEVYQLLKKNDYGLVRVAEQIIGDRDINILIVIDDFIDIFESEVDSRERTLFMRLIHKAYLDSTLPIFIVTSFNKQDFKDTKLRQEPKLHKALNMGVHKIKFLDSHGLKLAIEKPALLANSQVAADLGNEMMLMLLQDSDQLRKLQLLMSRTWMEWKRNHKDKTIGKAHYFRATGQKSKAVAKGLMKGGKVSVNHLESLAKQSAKADNAEMAKVDYQNLNDANKSLFRRIIPHLIDDSEAELRSMSLDRKKAGDLLGVTMEELGMLVTEIPTILAMDKKKLSVNDITIFESWEEIKEWIRSSNTLKLKFEQIAEAAILHYIDGIELPSVISRQQYKEQFRYTDLSLITRTWAMSQHEHYELGLDFIAKLQENYGVLDTEARSAGVKMKMTLGGKKKKEKAKPEMPSTETAEDEVARLEALKILGIAEEPSSNEDFDEGPNDFEEKQTSQESPEKYDETVDLEGENDEDAAIRRLLGGEDDSSENLPEEAQSASENNAPKELPDEELPDEEFVEKKKIAIKPKAKIVLRGNSNQSESGSSTQHENKSIKPKIVIKKK